MTERLSLDAPEFGAKFANIAHSWFRLETLQSYDVAAEAEQFTAFQAGEAAAPYDPEYDEWAAMLGRHVAAGRVLQRVHVIAEPLSDYLKYEIAWGYTFTAKAGEDIRVLPRPAGRWPAALPKDYDFWIFDDEVWAMAYDERGRPEYVERVTDPDSVAEHYEWRRTALELSIPVADYIATSPELRERVPVTERA